ncbi:unnamed protein product [Bemisia tabaci]|uniref:Cytochrome P450 n=2 Tax=Bemisia tabaci TaxID=7038 RepID=A0A9P0EYH9_BEMTA|nr:unnamed protein product [Bemisia tabaci]
MKHLISVREPVRYTLPILGHARVIMGGPGKIIANVSRLYEEMRGANFKVWALNKVCLIITNPDDIGLTLGSPHFRVKSNSYAIPQEGIMGHGLFTIDNMTLWKKNRKLITPAFHFQILKTFIPIFYNETKSLGGHLMRRKERNGEVEVSKPIGLCTLDMIMLNAMGLNGNAQESSDHVFVRGYDTVINVWCERMFKPWYLNKQIYNLSPLKLVHDKAMHDVQSFADQVILERLRAKFARSEDSKERNVTETSSCNDDDYIKPRESKVFLDMLLDYVYGNIDEDYMRKMIECLRNNEDDNGCASKTLSFSMEDGINERRISELIQMNRQIRDEVITILIGGQETTAGENSFALFLLALHQEVQEKLYAEMEDIFGDDSRPPTYEDLQRMTYTECVIKETMRLYPSLPVIVRQAEKDTILSDKTTVPKGCAVGYFVFGLHRDPKYYEDPEKFIPERFLPENSNKRHPYSFIPFSAGMRNCLGLKYAMLQMKTVISTLVRDYKFFPSERMPSMDSVDLEFYTVLRPKSGLWVRLERRDKT